MLQVEIPSSKDLQGAIVKTIAFFDLFEYPLTDWEIWRWLWGYECGFLEVRRILDSGLENIGNKNGFYFLRGRENIIQERLKRYNSTERKFRRAIKIAKLFSFIPWIKAIAVGNNIGAHNLKDSGDIDFFIITEKNRIWLSRFFCVGLIKILGLRPQANKVRDKICLSFFVAEEAIDLENLLIENDIYFVYWLAGLNFVYKKEIKFWESNGWIKKYLPNFQGKDCSRKIKAGNFGVLKIFSGFELLLKKLQLKLLPKNLNAAMNNNTNVVINDSILKLHANDRRAWYREEWKLNSNLKTQNSKSKL